MKNICVLLVAFACILVYNLGMARSRFEPLVGQDSIIINFGNGSKIVVYVANEADKEKLKNLDINALVKKVTQELEQNGNKDQTKIVNEDGVTMKIYYNQEKQNNKVVMDSSRIKRNWRISWDSDSDDKKRKEPRTFKSYLDLDLGLNNYIGTLPTRLYDLSPIGSRYVALGLGVRIRLKKTSPTYINTGLEVAWNNLMFENNNVRILKAADSNSLTLVESSVGQEKSKLVACYLNFPVTFSTRIKGTPFGVSIGGYAGYRLDSYAAFVENGRDKQRLTDSYFMNNLRYGIRAGVDLKYATLFCNYDLSPLFNTKNAPNLQVISFGVKLISGSL